ncbi:T9SS type A sorting domain-containing protein [Flavivirga algicola]|uniref:T9SS type A sorting domain-containing protein n=1 Tax=Flavivirga algicola TaxID=2729136 RepID=A0ABX1S252_9FLAO|nr:T9SS type A sorting domain-containing protein [Flavivirga algicola]NMH88983.1 T9SS type A sorting domain-containing protein [Flavivirga algicola]
MKKNRLSFTLKKYKKVSLFVLFVFLYFSLQAQRGLQYSPEEIEIWRARAGLVSGQQMYHTKGDVSTNSPGDWSRILADAKSCVNDSDNDRYTNYDDSRGLQSPITELNSPWVPNNTWPDRIPHIDAKEPRPGISGNDYAALSVMHAGFVYLLAGGDDQKVDGISGSEYAHAVKNELVWYAKNPWLDFSNTRRWVPSRSGGFNDRNPGFFIACWLNSMLNAYDYTKSSSVYTSTDRADIEKWLYHAMVFYHSLMYSVMSSPFTNYESGDYGSVTIGGWIDRKLGAAWEGAPYTSYGFNEFFANRSTVNWRFASRAALFLKDHTVYGSKAKDIVKDAHRWFKEWVIYGTYADGTHVDFHRGKPSQPQTGLQYATIAIGAVVDFADAYERVMHNDPSFESFYDWKVVSGSDEYNKYFPAATEERPWRNSLVFSSGSKGLETVISSLLKHFDGSYGRSRKWGNYPINGHSYPNGAFVKIVESERWVSLANLYYKKSDWTTIYTRTQTGTVPYHSNPTKAGSYDINLGSWGSHPGTLFMFGQMEGKVWPYSTEDPGPNPNPDPNTPFIEAEDHYIALVNAGTLGDVASVEQVNSLLSQEKGVKIYDRGDKLRIPFAVEKNGLYNINLRVRVGDRQNAQSYLPNGYKVQIDETLKTYNAIKGISEEDSAFGISYWGSLQFENIELEAGNHTLDVEASQAWGMVDYLEVVNVSNTSGNLVLEAEDIYEPVIDTGTHSSPSVAQDTSPLLSNLKAVKLYDLGDVINLKLEGINAGDYQIRIRVRSGDRSRKDSYFSNGYQVKINNVERAFFGDVESISERDRNFGIAYWGDLVSENSVSLRAGTNSIEIKALKNWALVDKLELIANPDSRVTGLVLDITKPFSLYPVPAKESITIKKRKAEDVIDDVSIYNFLGILIYRSIEAFDVSKTIHTGNMVKGNYIIKLRINGQVITEQFIIE